MKNIHLIPTDKPSRLVRFFTNKYHLCEEILPTQDEEVYMNIYITSDEEIKGGDWIEKNGKIYKCTISNDFYITVYEKNKYAGSFDTDTCKKIILTDNKDLIKDGVQSIDNEFLEWFVKNPTCEEVEVNKVEGRYVDYGGNVHNPISYKIIIPQEYPKQETLEEAAEKYSLEKAQKFALDKFPKSINNEKGMARWEDILEVLKVGVLTGYKFGKKYQAERMYSEEEVIELLNKREDCINQTSSIFDYTSAKEWFEQFKK